MNPADRLGEVGDGFYHSKTGGDRQEVANIMHTIRQATLIKAIVAEQPQATTEKPNYKLDLYGDGWAFPPTLVGVTGMRSTPAYVNTSSLPVGTPCYVISAGDIYVFYEAEAAYYLWLSKEWVAGGPNRMEGYACDGIFSAPPNTEIQKLPTIKINAVFPYSYFPSFPETVPTAGQRFYGSTGRILKGAVIYFGRYDWPISCPPFSGNSALGIPPDSGAPATWQSIGLAKTQAPFPYGTGKYLVCQIIDDLDPGTLGFDDPKFRSGAVTPADKNG
jgi:hypothetical protein